MSEEQTTTIDTNPATIAKHLHRFAHLMREGAKLLPQTSGTLIEKCGENYGTCAIGAAHMALTGDSAEDFYEQSLGNIDERNALYNVFSVLHLDKKSTYKHPVTEKQMTLINIVTTLNDDHGWTRERIAQWLDTIADELEHVVQQ